MLFHWKQKEIKVNLKITIDNVESDNVSKTKFLDVIINENLTWEDRIALVKTKVSKNIGVIRKIRNNLPRNTLLLLYYTLIHPYLNYCNITWACHDNVHTQSLYRLQKETIRLVTLAPLKSHSAPTEHS